MLSVVALVACGGGSDGGGDGRAGPAVDAGPPSSPPARRSAPYWVPLTQLSGTGTTTAPPFTVAPPALQWRLVFRCRTGVFSATATKATGEALRRPLATNAPCGDQEGEAFSGELGTVTVTVTTPGAWEATVEQQVDTPLVEPLTPALSAAQVVATATLSKVDGEGEGTARLLRLADGSHAVRLENFYTSPNTDLELVLSAAPSPKASADVLGAPYVSVSYLKATLGSMNYPVPAEVDVTQFQSLVIWSELTRVAHAAGVLRPGG